MGEKYIGTKFETIFQGKFISNKTEARKIKQLIELGKYLGQMGFEDNNGGNFSFKSSRGVVIKTTGSFPHKLKEDNFVLLNGFKKNKVFVFGDKEPSSEARLHWSAYEARPDINYVIHTHDFTAVNCPAELDEVVYIKEYPYGTIESARAVKKASKKGNYLMMENHGIIVLGKTIPSILKLIKKYHEKFKAITANPTVNCRIKK